jgi:hypothetical protein
MAAHKEFPDRLLVGFIHSYQRRAPMLIPTGRWSGE